jgi:hypothetical protein
LKGDKETGSHSERIPGMLTEVAGSLESGYSLTDYFEEDKFQ